MKTVIIIQAITIVILFVMWVIDTNKVETQKEEIKLLKCEKLIQFDKIQNLSKTIEKLGMSGLFKELHNEVLMSELNDRKNNYETENHAREN